MKRKQKEYTTEIAKKAMKVNKDINKSKKEHVKKVLSKAGYDPKKYYTKKERSKFAKLVRKSFYEQLPVVKGKQRPTSVVEYTKKEKAKIRKFMYTIDRRRSDNPMRCYAFMTDYFDASTRKEAQAKAKKIAIKYKKDTSFCGITIKDINGDNSIRFLSTRLLFAA